MEDQEFINQLAEKLSKLGTVRPLGFHYLHPYGTVPADSIICNGATYSRALYKDFFDYITTQGWVKSEYEWQKIARRDNGFCPFYSLGDGSTNFRTPKFAPYQQIAMEVAKATTYHQAGLPNIEGVTGINVGSSPSSTPSSGAFYHKTTTLTHMVGVGYNTTPAILFDASRNSNIYGASDTIQPEAHEWVMCVVAYGVATNVGSVDIQNVMSAVNAVQANVSAIPKPNAYVTKTWHSGTSWYRVWSDGFIEQGGISESARGATRRTIKLCTTFSLYDYFVVVQGYTGGSPNAIYNSFYVAEKSLSSFSTVAGCNEDIACLWYACGY